VSTRTKILAAVAALAVLVIVLSRGEDPDARLQGLKSDPTASYMPPGATLVDAKSENEGTSLGKPVPASYTRMFELGADAAGDAIDHAREAAVAAGWEVGERQPRAFVAEKTLPSGRAELVVSLFRDSLLLPKDVAPPALQISLRGVD
jgi:hypothetical protein